MDPDLSVIERLQDGDEDALVELMQRHKEAIFRLAWRYTRNQEDAADVTEVTFVKAYFKVGSFRPQATVKTWLFTIAANLCRDLLRRRKKEKKNISLDAPRGVDDPGDFKETVDSGEANARDLAESKEQTTRIEKAIHLLPHKLKFPFVFCILEGHSQDACADVLRTSRKTIETRIYRARIRLRKDLAALE